MSRPMFYDRSLTDTEWSIADGCRALNPGQTAPFNACKVTRALYGPWFYVENRSGYRCEIAGSTPTAVHVRNLNRAYHEEVTL